MGATPARIARSARFSALFWEVSVIKPPEPHLPLYGAVANLLVLIPRAWCAQGVISMAAKAAASAKPKAGKPVTTRVLAAALAEQHELSKKQGLEMLEDLIAMITKHLKKGERVKIAGLGILQVRKRAARMGRNPATGEAIKIKASKKVAFRAAKDLKMAI
jgi:DNA-binding protein HU-beta